MKKSTKEMIWIYGGKFIGAPYASLIMALPIKWMWNCLLPDIFGLPEITFWQAFGLYWFRCLLGRISKQDVAMAIEDWENREQ